jgi:hypothetical protein
LKRCILESDIPEYPKAFKVELEDGEARDTRLSPGEDYWLKYIKPVLKSLQKEKYRVSTLI